MASHCRSEDCVLYACISNVNHSNVATCKVSGGNFGHGGISGRGRCYTSLEMIGDARLQGKFVIAFIGI